MPIRGVLVPIWGLLFWCFFSVTHKIGLFSPKIEAIPTPWRTSRIRSVLSRRRPTRLRCRSRCRPAAHCAAVHRNRDAVPPFIAPPPLPIAIVPPPSLSPIATPSRQRPSPPPPPPPPSIDHAAVNRAAANHPVPPPIRRCPIAPPPSIAIAPPQSIVIAAAVHLVSPPIAPLPRWR